MPGSSSRSSTRTSTAGRRARASTATRTSSSGRCSGRARHLYDCDAVATGHYARRVVGRRRRARGWPAPATSDKDQTYFLYGLRQDQLEHARFPLGELTKPEVRVGRPLARPRDGRQAREPGDLLRPRRRLPGRAPGSRRLAARAGAAARRRRRQGRGAPRVGGVHGRPATGTRRRARRAPLRQPHRSAEQHDPARPPRGSRDDDDRRSSASASSPVGPPAGPTAPSAPRPGSATARRRSRRRSAPRHQPNRPAAGAGSSRPTTRSGPPRPARPASCTTARSSSAVAGSLAPGADAPAAPGKRLMIGPAPILAFLVGLFHTSLYVLDSRLCRRPAAAPARRRGPRGVGGRRVGARLGIDILRIGDFRLLRRIGGGVGRDRLRLDRRHPRPDAQEGRPVSDNDSLIARLGQAAEAVTGDDQRAATFARGLILGALVGAAIAGSTIWQRRRQARPGLPAPGAQRDRPTGGLVSLSARAAPQRGQ